MTAIAARLPRSPAPLPGAATVVLLVAAAFALGSLVPAVAPALWAMGLGVAAAPLVRRLPGGAAATRLAARPVLRAGVALLGLRIGLGELVRLGAAGVALDLITVAVTLLVTVRLGRALRVHRDLALLIGTGSAICGASAIAAMASATGADEERAGYAVATVTLFGTLAMVAVPALGLHLLGLSPRVTALWAGASIHEVAQVAGAGAAISATAVSTATLVKLGRVALLAPVVAGVSARRGGAGSGRRFALPGFVVAFLALVVLRNVVPVPTEALHASQTVAGVLLAAGLAGLGLGVHAAALRAAGARPLVLGLASWLTAACVALAVAVALAG